MRSCYGRWATLFTITALGKGTKPEDVKLPVDKQSMVTNVVSWLCRTRLAFNGSSAQQQGIVRCWNSTRLPQAFDSNVQAEAMERVGELFAKSSPSDFVEPGEEPDATDRLP